MALLSHFRYVAHYLFYDTSCAHKYLISCAGPVFGDTF